MIQLDLQDPLSLFFPQKMAHRPPGVQLKCRFLGPTRESESHRGCGGGGAVKESGFLVTCETPPHGNT